MAGAAPTCKRSPFEQLLGTVMASSLTEDLVCPICLAFFQEPHMLRCGHNFCLSCLFSVVPPGQEGTCPECREPFQMWEMRRNRALGSLATKVSHWKGNGEEPLPPDSGEPLGGSAKQVRPSEGEEELLPPRSPAEEMRRCCEAHDKPLELFCTQDEAPVCVTCRKLPQHRGHEFLPVPSAVQWAQGKLKAYLKPLKEIAKKKAKDELEKQIKIAALKDHAEDLLDHIADGFIALHKILLEKEVDIVSLVESAKEVDLEEMEESLISLKEDVSLCTETIAKIKAALEEADHVVFLKGFKKLMDQVKKYHQRNKVDNKENREDEDESSSDEDTSGAADRDHTEAMPINVHFKKIEDFLDFKPWKDVCERIIPVKELEVKIFGRWSKIPSRIATL